MAKDKSINTRNNRYFGLVDADLLDNGTRHPNLVLMKIAGYLRDHGYRYKLIHDEKEDLSLFTYIYESKVFSFTKEPVFIQEYFSKKRGRKTLFQGGTGYYVGDLDSEEFDRKRHEDMVSLEHDRRLPGFNMAHQMPDYTIYEEYVQKMIAEGKQANHYKDYLHYSIGFLTRGCVRHCPFCVNKNEFRIYPYSNLRDFLDESRPYIYLWDDNFLAAPRTVWRPLLEQLLATKRPFQFRQGLDLRLMTEEKAQLLSKANYHGDMLFAFDQWKDREVIQEKLKLWKYYYHKKPTKLYLFCGYELTKDSDDKLYEDVYYLFQRIKILMQYGCLGYVMRHQDYKNHPLSNIYVQIARWCNQPQFYKKMSFKEFIDRNQYYVKTENHICRALQTYNTFLDYFADKRAEIENLFETVKYTNLINPSLWAREEPEQNEQ